MTTLDQPYDIKIAQIKNDQFRTSVLRSVQTKGRCVITATFNNLAPNKKQELLLLFASFNDWTSDPDEIDYDEHDYGTLTDADDEYFFKIDCYSDDSFNWGSEDPTNDELTYRVLTIGCASDY